MQTLGDKMMDDAKPDHANRTAAVLINSQITTKALKGLPLSRLTGKPVVHFAHANGIPSQVYTPIFAILEAYFTVEYIAVLGFDAAGHERYPVDNHWKALTQQVLDSVQQAYDKHQVPIIGLGHSLGALCTLQAIYRQPQLFAQAVLMDPPMIYGTHNFLWHAAKMLSLKMVDKISPAGISQHRRDEWDSREQATALLRDKSLFKAFDSRTFAAYIEHGLRDTSDGKVTLTMPKKNEVAVFRTNPSLFWLRPNRPPKKAVTLLIGEDSQFQQRRFPQKILKRLSIPYKLHPGGHMFPLEHPDSVAKLIIDTVMQQAGSR